MGRLSAALGLRGGQGRMLGPLRGGSGLTARWNGWALEGGGSPGGGWSRVGEAKRAFPGLQRELPKAGWPGSSLSTPRVPAISSWPTSPSSARLSLSCSPRSPFPHLLFFSPGLSPSMVVVFSKLFLPARSCSYLRMAESQVAVRRTPPKRPFVTVSTYGASLSSRHIHSIS